MQCCHPMANKELDRSLAEPETRGQIPQLTLTAVPSKTMYDNYSALSPNINNENNIIYGIENKFPLIIDEEI